MLIAIRRKIGVISNKIKGINKTKLIKYITTLKNTDNTYNIPPIIDLNTQSLNLNCYLIQTGTGR